MLHFIFLVKIMKSQNRFRSFEQVAIWSTQKRVICNYSKGGQLSYLWIGNTSCAAVDVSFKTSESYTWIVKSFQKPRSDLTSCSCFDLIKNIWFPSHVPQFLIRGHRTLDPPFWNILSWPSHYSTRTAQLLVGSTKESSLQA